MKDDIISDSDHVSRYCSPSRVEEDEPLATAFELDDDDEYLSVNWLEYWNVSGKDEAMNCIRGEFDREVRHNGRFAVLNVLEATDAVRETTGRRSLVTHQPTSTMDSHAGIFGFLQDEREVAAKLASIVTRDNVFYAIVEES